MNLRTKYWIGAAVAVGLVSAASAFALARGASKAPRSGTSLRLTSTADVVFEGQKRDAADRVRIRKGHIGPDGKVFSPTDIRTITTFTCPAGTAPPCNAFRMQVRLDRTGQGPLGHVDVHQWADNNVFGFQLQERVNGEWLDMEAFTTVPAVKSATGTIALSDRAEDGDFPRTGGNCSTELPLESGQFFCPDPQQKFPLQGTANFLWRKRNGALAPATYYNELPSTERYEGSVHRGETGFAEFKRLNGFDANGTTCRGPVGAVISKDQCAWYRNENDLGWGRQMHCRTVAAGGFIGLPTKIACYVTNFRNENDAYTETDAIATVAMTWQGTPRPAGEVQDHVRFYVFDADGNRVNTAALDAGGEKDVPGLCLNCHGGSFSGRRVVGARFLPFDQATLPTAAAVPNQSNRFRTLNQFVLYSEVSARGNQASTPTIDLINGWYGGDFSGGTFNAKWRPEGWAGREGLYLGVVAPYCRSCHIAQVAYSFAAAAQFDILKPQIKQLVCNRNNRESMPHAQRTHQRFWENGGNAILAGELGALDSLGGCGYRARVTDNTP